MCTVTPTQEKVLALISAGTPISGAAETAGIHRNTIYNWLRTDARFRHALQRAREAKALFWRDQADELAATALETIRALMTDPAVAASLRLKAALSILNLATMPPAEPLPADFTERVHNSAQSGGELPDSAYPKPAEVVNRSAQPFRRSAPKTGRNEPCPCGSGRKFKHCCLSGAHAPAA